MDVLQPVVSGLLLGAIYALIAVGLTLLWGVMNVVNFAHGNLVMVAMYVTYFSWSRFGLDPIASIPVAAVVLAGLSLVIYQGAIRPVIKGSILAQMLVTFGVLIALQGGAQFLFTPTSRVVGHTIAEGLSLHFAGLVVGGPQLVAAGGALIGLLGVNWLLRRTEVGVALDAVSQDEQAAALMGVNVARMYAIAWLVVGATVGMAGALLMNIYAVDPAIGLNLGLIAFVVISLGGFGSIGGAMVAGLVMGVIQDVVGRYEPAWGVAAVFSMYLLVTFIRPNGLFGTSARTG